MPLRNTRLVRIAPRGCSDSLDGSNAFDGAMMALQNLVPAPGTDRNWVCRPAATLLTNFFPFGFSGPTQPAQWGSAVWDAFIWGPGSGGFISSLLVVGNIAYGTIGTNRNPGYDEPFSFNLATGQFNVVSNVLASNVPFSQPATGDWTPPIVAQIGSRVVVTHIGFTGTANKFGWFDLTGFTDSTTADSHTSITLDTLGKNVLQAGWTVGMLLTGPGIPANTSIVAIDPGGMSLTMSNAATASSNGITVHVAGGSLAAPLWAAGDTNINNLPSVPIGVAEFNGRAYFACGVNGIPYTDSLNAISRTNATQAIVPGNGLAVTAVGGLPLGASAVLGGVIQSIIAFQGTSGMIQITGDPTTNNLADNGMNIATGTLAPLSVTPTNQGLAFISPEGLRFVSFVGVVSDPIGDAGKGVCVPFINAINPSRICGAATSATIRFTVKNGAASGQPVQEWWFDLARKVFSGPHTSGASMIQPWVNTFVTALSGTFGRLYRSDAYPTVASVFVENSTQMIFEAQTVLSPADQSESAVIQSAIALALPAGMTVSITAFNEAGTALDTIMITGAGASALWGTAVWGAFKWGPLGGFLRRWAMPWHQPLVFKQASLYITGVPNPAFQLGDFDMQVARLGYQLQGVGSAAI